MDRPTFTEWQMKLLSDIFRVVLKEITTDEDKEFLAPGEIGISYTEGCLYVRNPHNGELFSPNSISHLKNILSKYDEYKNILNADRVSGVRVYSRISELSPIGLNMSMDSVIRQMEYPSILMASIDYTNYVSLGYPSQTGMIMVYKIDEENVMSTFYDSKSYITYDGRYNPARHFFEGWTINSSLDTKYSETVGGGDSTKVSVNQPLTDMMTISIRVMEELNPGAKISVNLSEYMPIVDAHGNPLGTTIAPNNIIMLIYDELQKSWVLLNPSESSVSSALSIVNQRLSDITASMKYIHSDTKERIEQLTRYVDTQMAKPGRIITVISNLEITNTNVDTIPGIDGFVANTDKLIVNYNQTVLREGIDYIIEQPGGIQMIRGSFTVGDTLQFIVLKQ